MLDCNILNIYIHNWKTYMYMVNGYAQLNLQIDQQKLMVNCHFKLNHITAHNGELVMYDIWFVLKHNMCYGLSCLQVFTVQQHYISCSENIGKLCFSEIFHYFCWSAFPCTSQGSHKMQAYTRCSPYNICTYIHIHAQYKCAFMGM